MNIVLIAGRTYSYDKPVLLGGPAGDGRSGIFMIAVLFFAWRVKVI